ncbi:MAG: hypothetical protein IKA36_06950 [Clostridia bacterium]|nr:hypothetical protein [Clostridia bacterium]
MYNGYQNQELMAAEAEFQRQLGSLAATGRFSQQQIAYIQSVWEQQKAVAYDGARQRLNSPVIGSALTNFVQGFINLVIKQITSTVPMGNPYGYGMAAAGPFMGNPYGGMPMMQMSPFSQPSYQQMQGINYMPQQTPEQSSGNPYASIPQQHPQTTQQTVKQEQKDTAPAKTLTIKKVEYVAPTVEDNDTAYGNEEHITSIGSIKVIPMRDCIGAPFKQVMIRLAHPCRNKMEAINQARLLYKDKSVSHIDIQYDLAITLPIAYDKGKKVFTSLKKAIPKTVAAANQLKYIQAIQKVLDDETRGVANVLEDFMVDRFNYVAGVGCVDCDYNGVFSIESLRALINLSDKDTADKACQAWQAKAGFMNGLINCCNSTIKNDITNCEILDPSDPKRFMTIIKHFTGLTESDEGKLIDVGLELLPKAEEFCKASQKEKMTNFGAAGEIVAGSTTILLKNQHLVLTDLIPESSMGRMSDNSLCIAAKTLIIGGYTNDEPNEIDSNFEYMMLKASLGSEHWVDIVVNYNQVLMSMKAVQSIDKWTVITPTTF